MKKRTAQPSFFLFYFLKQRDRVRRDAKSLSGKTEPLLGRRLDADAGSIKRKHAGEIFPHPLTVGRELRSLRQNRRIKVDDGISRLTQPLRHTLEQQDARDPGVSRVRIGKELADIAQRRRAELQEKYFVYLTAELAPRILTLNNAKKGTRIWTAGVDLGAYHAVHCRLRRPALFAGAVGMGGIYDLTRFWGTDSDDMVLRCSPLAYLQESGIANKLALTKAEENCLILCAGQGAYEGDALDDTQALADLLKDQGMPAHLEVWGGDVSHDWYWWGKMWSLFAPRILEVK